MDGNLAKNRQAIVQAGMPSPALGSLLAPLGDPPALRMLNLQNLFRNDTRSVGEAPLAPATFPQGFPSRGRLDGLQRKANRKHIIFKEPTDHLQSGHVALLTFLSSFSENHSSSAPKALLRGLTPPASPGKATQLATESAPQASFSPSPAFIRQLVISWLPHQGLPANGSPTSSSSRPGFPVSVDGITAPSASPLEMSESSLTHPSHSPDQTSSPIT